MKHFKANEAKPCTKRRGAARPFLSAFVRAHLSAGLSAPPTLQIKQHVKFARLVFYEKAAASHAINSFELIYFLGKLATTAGMSCCPVPLKF